MKNFHYLCAIKLNEMEDIQKMDIYRGMLLLRKDKESTLRDIKSLCDKYNAKQTNNINIQEEKSIYRNYFHDVGVCLKACFYDSFGCIRRCLSFIKFAQSNDDINYQRIAMFRVFGFLMNLYQIVPKAISIDDFPSCKDLLKLSEGDLLSAANDLIGNKVVKGQISLVLLGKDAGELLKISDIMAFYDNMANDMLGDINEKMGVNISLESFLLAKAKAESAYCFLAMLKIGHSIEKETKSVFDARKDIEKYEEICQQNGISGLMISNKYVNLQRV